MVQVTNLHNRPLNFIVGKEGEGGRFQAGRTEGGEAESVVLRPGATEDLAIDPESPETKAFLNAGMIRIGEAKAQR